MREITISLFLASTLLLSGCVDSSSRDNKTPTDTLKLLRGVSQDGDWTWYVKTAAKESDGILKFKTDFDLAIQDDAKHIQYFIDTDNNANTGFTTGQDSWRIAGADILIEDGNVYKSLSNGGEWKWKYITHVDNYSRSKYEILFNVNKNILNSNSDRVNVTMEAFDANWNGSYDTISTQVVPFAKSNNKKSPKEILQKEMSQAGGGLIDFVYTPQHQGAIVLKGNTLGETLSLYGLEDSQNPVHEYDISFGDEATKFSDIKMLGNGQIQYLQKDDNGQESHTYSIIYDYFHKKQISKTEIGGKTENNKTPKEIINDRLNENLVYLAEFVYTPQHQGAIVLEKTQVGPHLALYGLEDPHNPVREYEIDLGDDATKISDIKMLDNGKIQYVKADGYKNPIKSLIVYDYFHKKQISKTKISNSITIDPDTINSTDQFKDEQNIVLDIIKDKIIKNGWKPPRIEIEGIRKIDNTHYIVRYIIYYFDFRAKIEIFDIENKKPTVTLESWKEGPGGTQLKDGDFIQIDLVKKTVSYKQTNSFDDLLSEYVKNYLTGETISLKETHMGY